MSVAQIADNGTTYRNAKDSLSTVTPAGILAGDAPSSGSSSLASTASSSPQSTVTQIQFVLHSIILVLPY